MGYLFYKMVLRSWDEGYILWKMIQHYQDNGQISHFWKSQNEIQQDTFPWSTGYSQWLQKSHGLFSFNLVLLIYEISPNVLNHVILHLRPYALTSIGHKFSTNLDSLPKVYHGTPLRASSSNCQPYEQKVISPSPIIGHLFPKNDRFFLL